MLRHVTRPLKYPPTRLITPKLSYSSQTSTASTSQGSASRSIAVALTIAGSSVAAYAAFRFFSPPRERSDPLDEEINAKLRVHERTHPFPYHPLVRRVDVAQVPSNNPCEDRYAVHPVSDGHGWVFVVCDGHAGWDCSELVHKELPKRVVELMGKSGTERAAGVRERTADETESVLINAFVGLDREIVQDAAEKALALIPRLNGSLSEAERNDLIRQGRKLLGPATAGACTVLTYLDGVSRRLSVACTGDSRVVVGELPEGVEDDGDMSKLRWRAIRMSEDQTLRNSSERTRFTSEHPDESPDVLTARNRVLGGLEPTRAFGDSRYKWTRQVSDTLHQVFYPDRRGTPAASKTPPYVTAKPEVRHLEVTERTKCIVMATDGLWDCLKDEQVVDILEQHARKEEQALSMALRTNDGVTSKVSRWIFGGNDSLDRHHGPWAHEDENAATCLIRNALGGTNKSKVLQLLRLEAPLSRRYRDDITVTVVWLDAKREGLARAWQDDVKKQGWKDALPGKPMIPALQKEDT